MKNEILLSVIIPCYNEEARLQKNLPLCLSYLKSVPYGWELIFVNDGSRDETVKLIKKYSLGDKRILLLSHQKNLGKGRAIKNGILQAKGKYSIFFDADLSVPIKTIGVCLKKLTSNDIVIGVRRNSKSKIIKHQPWIREQMGRIFTKIINFLLLKNQITDATCGFKGFETKKGKKIFIKQKMSGWSFDAEILFLALKNNYQIYELPVSWTNDERTKVSLVKDSILSLIDIFKIKFNDYLKKYN